MCMHVCVHACRRACIHVCNAMYYQLNVVLRVYFCVGNFATVCVQHTHTSIIVHVLYHSIHA